MFTNVIYKCVTYPNGIIVTNVNYCYLCKQKRMIERIKKMMDKRGLTPSQFADEIGLKRSSLSHILSGRNNPSLDVVMKIKNRFDEISLDWLLFGKGTEVPAADTFSVPPPKLDPTPAKKTESGQQLLSFEGPKAAIKADTVTKKSDEKEVEQGQPFPKAIINPNGAKKLILLYGDGTFETFESR